MVVEMTKFTRFLQLYGQFCDSSENIFKCLTKKELKELDDLEEYFEEAEEWYEGKQKYYDMRKQLEAVITKRNLELKHIKKKIMSESDRMKIQWFDERMTIGENKTIYYKPARNLTEVEKNEKKIAEIMELFKDFEWTYEKAYYAMKEVSRIVYN